MWWISGHIAGAQIFVLSERVINKKKFNENERTRRK